MPIFKYRMKQHLLKDISKFKWLLHYVLNIGLYCESSLYFRQRIFNMIIFVVN